MVHGENVDEDVEVQFQKELVDDIRKLMFLLGSTPLAENAHRGITPLAFVLLSVEEENTLRLEQEAYDGATSHTPAMMRASKRGCPKPPMEYDPFDRLLQRYIKSGQWLFGVHCPHFREVVMVK